MSNKTVLKKKKKDQETRDVLGTLFGDYSWTPFIMIFMSSAGLYCGTQVREEKVLEVVSGMFIACGLLATAVLAGKKIFKNNAEIIHNAWNEDEAGKTETYLRIKKAQALAAKQRSGAKTKQLNDPNSINPNADYCFFTPVTGQQNNAKTDFPKIEVLISKEEFKNDSPVKEEITKPKSPVNPPRSVFNLQEQLNNLSIHELNALESIQSYVRGKEEKIKISEFFKIIDKLLEVKRKNQRGSHYGFSASNDSVTFGFYRKHGGQKTNRYIEPSQIAELKKMMQECGITKDALQKAKSHTVAISRMN